MVRSLLVVSCLTGSVGMLHGCGLVDDPSGASEAPPEATEAGQGGGVEPQCHDQLLFRDLDSDGCGSETAETLCIENLVPSGWTLWGGCKDCDDENRSVFPGAAEVPGDGVDSDCDGDDDTRVCASECECIAEERGKLGRPTASTCDDAPDVFIPVVQECNGCGISTAWIVLANQGAEPASNVSLSHRLDDGIAETVSVPTIEPLGISAVIMISIPWTAELGLTVETAGDCDASNNQATAQVYVGLCK
jgi:hypothetical protein